MARMSIDDKFLRDPRITQLALDLNMSRWEAMGRLLAVFSACYDLERDIITCTQVDLAAERPGFGDAMFAVDLAVNVRGGMRIRGAGERIKYLSHKAEAGRIGGLKSGEIRKNSAKQNRSSARSSGGSNLEARGNPPDPVPDPAPDPVPDQIPDLPPAHAIPPSPEPAVPAVSPPVPAREDIARTQPIAGDQFEASKSTAPSLKSRTWTDQQPIIQRDIKPSTPPPAPPAETSLEALWSEFEAERQRVARVLRIELLPLAAHDRGRNDLANALAAARAAGERQLEVRRIRRAIAVAGAEAEGSQDSQWLTGAVFTQDNLRRLSGTTPAKAKQAAAERRAATQARARGPSGKPEIPSMPTPPKFKPEPPLPPMSAEDRAAIAELAARIGANPEAAAASLRPADLPTSELVKRFGDGPRAPPASVEPTNPDDESRRRKAAK